MVKRIDPHTHSAYSDGTDTPAQLLAIAAQAGLDAIALTDHDTTAGWDEAVAAPSELLSEEVARSANRSGSPPEVGERGSQV